MRREHWEGIVLGRGSVGKREHWEAGALGGEALGGSSIGASIIFTPFSLGFAMVLIYFFCY